METRGDEEGTRGEVKNCEWQQVWPVVLVHNTCCGGDDGIATCVANSTLTGGRLFKHNEGKTFRHAQLQASTVERLSSGIAQWQQLFQTAASTSKYGLFPTRVATVSKQVLLLFQTRVAHLIADDVDVEDFAKGLEILKEVALVNGLDQVANVDLGTRLGPVEVGWLGNGYVSVRVNTSVNEALNA